MRRGIYRLCLVALAAGLLLPAAQKAEAQSLTITGPGTLAETDTDFASGAYTVTRTGTEFAAETEITLTLGVDAVETTANADLSGGPADVALSSTTVTFNAGEDTKTFTVTVTGDDVNEATETFTVVTSGGGGSLTHAAAHATTITDDDDITCRVSAPITTVSEGDGSVNFTLTLSGPSQGVLTVLIGRGEGTTIDDSDVGSPAIFSSVLNAGITTGMLSVTLNDDMVNEDDETLNLLLFPFNNGSTAGPGAGVVMLDPDFANQMAPVTITDNDPITVTIARHSSTPATIDEGGTATFTATLNVASAGVVTVPYTVSGTTETPTDANGGSITIPAGRTTGNIVLGIPSSRTLGAGASETLTVALDVATVAAPGGGTVTSTDSAMVTVRYTATRTLTITGPTDIAEGATGVESGIYTVTLDGANFSDPTAVTWTVVHGETEDADFVAAADRGGTLMFGTSDTRRTFTLTVAADMLNEARERFTVNIGVADPTADGGTLIRTATGTALTTTISDHADDAIEVTIARVGGANVDEAATVDFSVTLAGGVRTSALTVPFIFRGSLGNAEYDITMPTGIPATDIGGTLTFAADGSEMAGDSMIVTVNLIGDTMSEASETLTITGLNLVTAGVVDYSAGGVSAMVTVDDAVARTLTITGPDMLAETDTDFASGAYTVTRTGTEFATETEITLTVTHTTTEDADITVPASVTFAAGADTQTFTVTVIGDNLNEATETFAIATSGGGSGITHAAAHTTTINDNDTISIFVLFDLVGVIDLRVTEGETAMADISIDADSATPTEPIEITYTIASAPGIDINGNNIDGAEADDYSDPGSGSLTIPADASPLRGVISLTTVDDDLYEPVERLRVTIAATSAGAVNFPGSNIYHVQIFGNDSPVRILTVTGAGTHAETDTNTDITYTVSLSGTAFATPTTLTWRINMPLSGPAPNSGDFAEIGGTIVFPTMRTFAVTVAGDDLTEEDETFIVNVRVADPFADGGTGIGADQRTTITDDDADRTLTVTGPADIAEGAANVESGTYTVTLDGANFGAATAVTWTVAHGETEAADFVAPADRSGTLNFGASDTSMTFTLNVAADNLNEADEGFTVNVSVADFTADGGTHYGAAHTTTISDAADDAIGVTMDYFGAFNVNEAATVDFSVTLSGGVRTSALTVPFDFRTAGPRDLDNAEYAITVPAGLPADATGGTLTFAADGSQTASDSLTIRVNLIGDTLNEDRNFLNITGGNLVTAGAVRYASFNNVNVSVTDDDPIAATLSGGGRVAEGGTATVNVALGATTTSEVTLSYDIGGVGVSTADFSGIADLLDNTITIASGQSSASIALALAADDTLNEADKDFTVTVVPADFMGQFGDATVADGTQTFTIADNDPITVSIARAAGAPATIAEGDTATFTVTLSVESAGEVTVPYTTSGTTSPPTDPDSGSITFAARQTTRDIALTVPFGSAFGSGDAAETLTVALGAARAAAPGGGTVTSTDTATVTVNYIDAMHRVGFSSPAATIAEGAAATTYVVSRTGPAISTGNSIVVRWSYAAGTSNPAAAADFVGGAVPAGGMLTFMGNETSKMFTVATQADLLNEAGETFTLDLSAANMVLNSNGGVVLGDAVAVTITDDAADAITVTIERVGGANVGEAAMANFSVMLSGGVRTADLIVPFAFSGLDNAEYAITMPTGIAADATGGTLTFLADSTQTATDRLTVTVNLMGNPVNEATETLTITGGSLATAGAIGYAAGGGDSATVTVDDDDPITVSVARHSSTSATIDEGATATFTFSLDVASAGVVTVPYTVANTTAGYVPTDSGGGSITFSVGETTRDITLMMPSSTTFGSTTPDGTVTVTLNTAIVAPPGGGTVSSGSPATVMVNYIGESQALAFTNPPTRITEGETATYTVTRTGTDIMPGNRIVVSWSISTAGAVNPASVGQDYVGLSPSGDLTFTGSERTKTFTIDIAEDALSEPDEDFFILLRAAAEVTLPGNLRVVIGESDREITLSVTQPVGALTEGTPANFTVSFPEAVTTTAPVTMDWAISFPASSLTVTPAETADFAPGALTGTASIPAGMSSVNFAITALADLRNEAGESFIVTFSNAAGGGAIAVPLLFGFLSPEFTIAASDPITATLGGGGVSIAEGSSGSATVTLSGATATADVVVNYVFSGAGITAGDITGGLSGSITIDADATPTPVLTGTIPIAAIADMVSDADETLTVTATATSAGQVTVAGSPQTFTIVEDGRTLSVGFIFPDSLQATGEIAERERVFSAIRFRINRTGPDFATFVSSTITWSIDHISTSDSDFFSFLGPDGLTGSAQMRGRTSSAPFEINLNTDTLNEPDESFRIALSLADPDADGGTTLVASREITITDNDAITATLGGGASIFEGDSGIATVMLSGATATADVVVNYSFSGTGITADDITGSLSGSITIDADATPAVLMGEIPIATINDRVTEATETMTFTATATSAGQVTVVGSPQIFNIVEETRTLTVTGPADIAEGAANVESGTYTVTLDGANFGAATAVTWTVAHGETADADFVAPADRSGILNFGASDTSMTFTLTVAADNLNEASEGFTVNVSVANPDADGGTFINAAHTTTISDAADDAIGVTIDYVGAFNVNEAATVDFSVTLSGGVRTSALTVPFDFRTAGPRDLDNAEYAITVPAGLPADATGGTLTFAADGSQTASDSLTIRVNLIGDTLNEDRDLLNITGGNLVTAGAVRYASFNNVTVSVTDDDPIAATLSGGGRVAEGGTATVNVALGATTTSEVTLSYDIGGVGVSTADFSGIADLLDNTITIASGQSSASIALALAADDTLNEADKDFTVTVVPADFMGQFGDATVADGTQTFTIADNDPITVSIARAAGAPATIAEGDTATFTVTLSVESAGEVTVPYTTSGTTAAPTDPDSGSITFAARQTTRDIALTVPFGSAFGSGDAAETLTVALGAARAAAPGGGTVTSTDTATVTVNYIDAMHRVEFSSPAAMIAEGAAATTYVVSRTGPAISTGNSIVVSWTYAAGTSNPAAAADFMGAAVPAGGMLTFMGNETSKMFTVTTQADLLNEAGETFTLGLTAANMVLNSNGGVVLGDAVAVTIADDAADAIEVTIERVGGANVGEAAMANFSVTLAGGVRTADLIAPFAFSGLDNAEYAITMPTGIAADATGGTLTFLADSTQTATDRLTVTANLMGDPVNEAAETLTITGTAPGADGLRTAGAVRYAADGDSATVTVDDDDPITVSVARHSSTSATIDEGATATFTFSLNVASAGVVTVPYTVANTTAGYVPTDSGGGSITFSVGETTRDITLMMPSSAMLGSIDSDGTVTVTLGSARVAAPGGGTVMISSTSGAATVMVNYIGDIHVVTFSNPPTSIVEGTTATYTVTRTGPDIMPGTRIVVSWGTHTAGSINPPTALLDRGSVDFAGALFGSLTFTGSETSKTFTFATVEDPLSEPDEDLTLFLRIRSAPPDASVRLLAADLTVVIGESDRPITLSVMPPVGALTEGTPANFAVSFPEAVTTTAPVTVDWAISFPSSSPGVIPAEAADFAPSMMSGTASIGAGTSSVNVAITALADSLNEAEERFIVTLSAPAGGGAIAAPVLHATPSATAAIAASDPVTATLGGGGVSIAEGSSGSATVTLSGATATADVVVNYVFSGAGITAGDITGGLSGSITIDADATPTPVLTGTIPIAAIADMVSDADETLTVTVTATSAGQVTVAGSPQTFTLVEEETRTLSVGFVFPPLDVDASGGRIAERFTRSIEFRIDRTGPDFATPASSTVTWSIEHISTGVSDFSSSFPLTGSVQMLGRSSFFPCGFNSQVQQMV